MPCMLTLPNEIIIWDLLIVLCTMVALLNLALCFYFDEQFNAGQTFFFGRGSWCVALWFLSVWS